MNNVKKTIGWADYTWNPVTGCKRLCRYCYAKRIHERFYQYPFTVIVYHGDRLHDPGKVKKPSTIFVGSMSDIEYWDYNMLSDIIDICKINKQHTFMFLSKNADSYIDFDWPDNTMQGLTLEKCDTGKERIALNSLVSIANRPFVSLEPILGNISFNPAWQYLEKIIVGAMTGYGAIAPKREWIDSIQEFIRGDRIFWKDSVKNQVKL